MPRIEFTSHLARHVEAPARELEASALREAFEQVFLDSPRLRGYILDDQGQIRQHVAVFVDNVLLRDRVNWNIPLRSDSRIFVMQALSGG